MLQPKQLSLELSLAVEIDIKQSLQLYLQRYTSIHLRTDLIKWCIQRHRKKKNTTPAQLNADIQPLPHQNSSSLSFYIHVSLTGNDWTRQEDTPSASQLLFNGTTCTTQTVLYIVDVTCVCVF